MRLLFFFSAAAGMLYIGTCTYSNSKKEKAIAAERYSAVRYDSLKKSVEALKQKSSAASAHGTFVNLVSEKMFPFWYETEWDFNGTTEVPRQGSIACGYFVTTVLRDAGVKLERVKLACCASEQMIKTLTTEKHIRRFSNVKLEKFCSEVKKKGKGLFVIGLDSHTGFLLNTGEQLYFVHSNGYGWREHKVIKELAEESKVLETSAYRVVGFITEDKEFLERWMNNK